MRPKTRAENLSTFLGTRRYCMGITAGIVGISPAFTRLIGID
ncbi:MAG: hypothetical protein Q8R70_06345 [Methanoregula sp.]|nr:hypothetical protein [Methanoregula sp.]